MFYFPVLQGQYPEWFPLWGGDEFLFFRPVFNVADASISMGVILMIVFQKRVFGHTHDHKEEEVITSEITPSEENPNA
jgi:signal peptidase II